MRRSLVAARSVPVLASPEEGAELVTEVIVGERLEVLERCEGWLRIVVPEHGTHLDPLGYPGWVPESAPLEDRAWNPDLTVIAKNYLGLPLGARLERQPNGALLPDGRAVEIEDGTVAQSGADSGCSAIEVSRSLLGLPYRWGGTDSTVGMDCSGMVYRIMQLLGAAIPRDAGDQYEEAPSKSRETWELARQGDLVFFGEGVITHVGFYLGNGRYISEHGVGETIIRSMNDDPYWGFARYARR